MRNRVFFFTTFWVALSCSPQLDNSNQRVVLRDEQAVKNALPPTYLSEPPSNEGTNLLADNDGSIKFIYREGDWDHGGFSEEIFSMETHDQGNTWTKPEVICNTGPGKQCFATISPTSGEVIVFYIHEEKGLKGNYKVMRTQNNRKDYSHNVLLDSVWFNGVGYGSCLWIDMPNGKKRVLTGVHGDNSGAGTYYSDDDGFSWSPSNRAKVPNLIPNIWQTGSVEPAFLEMKDGRIWMLMRNSNDHLWESFSTDKGETWSDARPTRFKCGPNSWVTLKRLSTGEILVLWNNAMPLPPAATQDIWSFTNRDVIHAAISSDEGKTWHGFRELWLDQMRDSSNYVNHPGDKGLNESKAVETKEGNVLIACGQAPGHRGFLLLDPAWLYQKTASDHFHNGLKNWSCQKLIVRSPIYSRLYHYRYNRKPGAELVPHPSMLSRNVLHVRKESDSTLYSQRDGAVWNFPNGMKGRFETKVYLNPRFSGITLSLTDRWYQPIDNQGEDKAMYQLYIPRDGVVGTSTKLERQKWYTIALEWDLTQDHGCRVFIDGIEMSHTLPLQNPSANGISYIRFRSSAIWEDLDGCYIEYVKADVE